MQTPCSSKLAADFFPVRGDTGEGTEPGVAHGLVLIRLTDGRSDAADHGAGNNQWHAPGKRHPAWKREQSGVVRDGRLQLDVGVRVVAAVRAFSVAASGVCNRAPSRRCKASSTPAASTTATVTSSLCRSASAQAATMIWRTSAAWRTCTVFRLMACVRSQLAGGRTVASVT